MRKRYYNRKKRIGMKRFSRKGMFIPPIVYRKMSWSKTYNIDTSVLDVYKGEALRLSGPYDPQYLTGMGQSSAFDWGFYSNYYNNYVVHGAKVTFTVAPQGAGQDMHFIGALINPTPTVPCAEFLSEDPAKIMSYGKCKNYMLLQGCNYTTDRARKFSIYYSPKKVWGKHWRTHGEANTNNVPADDNYLHWMLAAMKTSSVGNHGIFMVYVQVDYLVEFYEARSRPITQLEDVEVTGEAEEDDPFAEDMYFGTPPEEEAKAAAVEELSKEIEENIKDIPVPTTPPPTQIMED
jgi:hypothetical protein